jgi:hypothetical protein
VKVSDISGDNPNVDSVQGKAKRNGLIDFAFATQNLGERYYVYFIPGVRGLYSLENHWQAFSMAVWRDLSEVTQHKARVTQHKARVTQHLAVSYMIGSV